jgi:hypothetical protein
VHLDRAHDGRAAVAPPHLHPDQPVAVIDELDAEAGALAVQGDEFRRRARERDRVAGQRDATARDIGRKGLLGDQVLQDFLHHLVGRRIAGNPDEAELVLDELHAALGGNLRVHRLLVIVRQLDGSRNRRVEAERERREDDQVEHREQRRDAGAAGVAPPKPFSGPRREDRRLPRN